MYIIKRRVTVTRQSDPVLSSLPSFLHGFLQQFLLAELLLLVLSDQLVHLAAVDLLHRALILAGQNRTCVECPRCGNAVAT